MTQKKKIFMLCDHPLSTSGVGTQSRWLIHGLVATGKYSFNIFGGAVRHDDLNTITVTPDFIIKPTNGFGDKNSIRHVLATLKPDAVFLFTDPRFFFHVFEIEDEIHQVCPIVYNHLWDNYPTPRFNDVLYDSTDLINCINWPTYEMVSKQFPDRTNYVPHAVPPNLYFPLSPEDAQRARVHMLGKDRADHFVVLYVGRNARRKAPSDVIASFKQFVNELEKKHGHRKATLLMHTDPLDQEGPNLHHVIDMLKMGDHVVFSRDKADFQQMNVLYNTCDALVNASYNEGFGLPLVEAKMCGKPVIATKTGGMTRQVEDHETGEQYGIAMEPDVKTLVGNQMVPYIFEDMVSHDTLANAYMQLYELGPQKRLELGQRAREHALKNYNIDKMVKDWDMTLEQTIDAWKRKQLPNNKRWETTTL